MAQRLRRFSAVRNEGGGAREGERVDGGDRIERIELHHVEVPLPTPLFPAWVPGHAVDQFSATLFVLRTQRGLVGCATGPSLGREREGLGEFIGPFLVGLDPYDLDGVHERLREASYLGWRNNWIDVAFWDVAAQARGIPVHELLTERLLSPCGEPRGAARPSSPNVAGREPPERVATVATHQEVRHGPSRVESVERALRMGFQSVMFGVGHGEEDADIELLRSVREAVGSGPELYVHAHQGWRVSLVRELPRWTFERARRFVEEAARLAYRRVQEPLHEGDIEGIERLRSVAPLPLGGGDVAVSGARLRILARLGCYDVLTPSVSFAGLGRLEAAMRAALDYDLDFSPMTYGDGFELTAHLHAVAAWSRLRGTPARLSFPWDPPAQMPEYRDALLGLPLHVDSEGCLPVPTAPGLGVCYDPSALNRFTTPFYETTPVRLMVASARTAGLRQTQEIAQRSRKAR
ncbi:MAG: enolase C-terminal domain-like protein [Myxococcota bacterium]